MKANNIVIPLLLAHKAGEEGIHGRTRLQKFVFLTQKKLEATAPSSYNFIPYDYGPFSKELAEDMNALQDEGLIEKREIRKGEKTEHLYEITDEGVEELDDLKKDFISGSQTVDLAGNLIQKWNNESLNKLLSYVYYSYPDYAEESVL